MDFTFGEKLAAAVLVVLTLLGAGSPLINPAYAADDIRPPVASSDRD